jgi:phosphate transport system substrate-binding protein
MKTILVAAVVALVVLFFAFSGRQAASAVIAGSTSVLPYVEILAEEYFALYPDKIIDVQGGGSSAGIMAVLSGIADLGMSSRELRPSEEELLWKIEIAKDGLAIITNPNNPVDSLTGDQLKGIYTGSITNWEDVGGNDARIHVIAREEGSGTRGAFEELMKMDFYNRITSKAIVMNSNGAVRQLVSGDDNSIGFISLGLVNTGYGEPVKAVSIDGVDATPDNVRNEDYKLFRSFLLVAVKQPQRDSPAWQFINFIFTEEGQQILAREGLVAMKSDGWGEEE